MNEIAGAYDAIAGDYHALHADWRTSVTDQGRVLGDVLADRLGAGPLHVLDCSCGIGTQAIGLLLEGHDVLGTDLSGAALERARAEALSFGVTLETQIADMRDLSDVVSGGPFDAIVSCDNSVAHLAPAELAPACAGMARLLRPGGMVLISLRDYAPLRLERPRLTTARMTGALGERAVTFQLWEWAGDAYDATLVFVNERGDAWEARSETVHLHAHLVSDIAGALARGGLVDVRETAPSKAGFHQPLVTALTAAW